MQKMKRSLTVLMGLMKIDIGGAETHVVVLARHLTELGYRVIVASQGGCFEEELADYGVKHYRVPMHNTKFTSILKSYAVLHRIVKTEEVDIIHAHARIPAFVAALIRSKSARFITTAHSNFQGLRFLSQWGEMTIAVSEDIRRHLIAYFRVPPEKIVVIPNGIDTELFSPAAGTGDLRKEDGTTLVTLVSRLDGELAAVAIELIAAFERVYEQYPSLRLNIIGDGDGSAAVRARAAELNTRVKKSVVTMLGARTDVNKLLAGSDLVAGVSRAALEGMACGTPVLLAGSQGFGGLLNEENIDRFRQDNFTARSGGSKASADNLAAALIEFLKQDEARRRYTGEFLRGVVLEEYDSLSMAKKVARVYEDVYWREAGP